MSSPIIVVTNRNLNEGSGDPLERFGPDFNDNGNDELRLAIAEHKNRKWQIDILEDKSVVNGVEVNASEGAFLQLQERMREKKRNCLFYVHGFNNDFADVMESARDLQETYDVEVIVFTWPANGRDKILGRVGGTVSYKSDKRDATLSVVALDRVFEKLFHYIRLHQDKACDQNMSLMFHSMGNYLFKNMFKSDVYMGETALFDNVILCQADVNNIGHETWVDSIAFRNRLYITINEKDYALAASRIKFGEKQKARLGHYTMNLNSRMARYIDFTGAKGVKKAHAPFHSDVANKNAKVKETFRKIIHGERAEEGLRYNSHSRTYEVAK